MACQKTPKEKEHCGLNVAGSEASNSNTGRSVDRRHAGRKIAPVTEDYRVVVVIDGRQCCERCSQSQRTNGLRDLKQRLSPPFRLCGTRAKQRIKEAHPPARLLFLNKQAGPLLKERSAFAVCEGDYLLNRCPGRGNSPEQRL